MCTSPMMMQPMVQSSSHTDLLKTYQDSFYCNATVSTCTDSVSDSSLEDTHKTKKETRLQNARPKREQIQKPNDYLDYLIDRPAFTDDYWAAYFVRPSLSLPDDSLIIPPELLKLLRSNDLTGLQRAWKRGDLQDCQQWRTPTNGETLLHVACRMGCRDIITFVLHELHMPLRVRDTSGKTILHELCWNPNSFCSDLMLAILRDSPELLFVKDQRGFTPLQYVPAKCHGKWCDFLDRHYYILKCAFQLSSFRRSSHQLQANQARLQALLLEKVQKQ
jgi:ankyrin repeat protein